MGTGWNRLLPLALAVSSAMAAPVLAQDGYTDQPVYADQIGEVARYDAMDALPSPMAPDALQPGEFEWTDASATGGPVTVLVSLATQRAYVYRDGQRVATSTISSGKPGNDTPTGVFPILQKRKVHHSNRYNNAPMPFMQRLTWDGIALHAGQLPGRPASHGCVRLPREFAKRLFDVTSFSQTVVVISNDEEVASLQSLGLSEQQLAQVGVEAAPMFFSGGTLMKTEYANQ